jgi:hypothetical protein
VGQGDVGAAEACGDGAGDVASGWGANSAAGAGASWLGEGLEEREDAAAADEDGGAAKLGTPVGDETGGAAAAAGWPAPSVTESAMPPPTRARTLAKTAMPERKLISSMRAFITRLSLAAQPVPSLTTKHDTWVSGVLLGTR